MKRKIFITLLAVFVQCIPLLAQRTFQYGNNGRFDAEFDQQNCLLTITVRVTFSFEDGPLSDDSDNWPNDSLKTVWKNEFIDRTQRHWSGRYRFEASNATTIRGCERVRVQVVIVEVTQGEHFRIKVKKRKDHQTSRTHGGIVDFDSHDLEERGRNQRMQTGAFHEFGHMIGLPDEPSEINNSQMSHGDEVKPEHYNTFEQALEELTNTKVRPVAP